MNETKKTDMKSPDKINADTRILFGPTISNTCKSCAGFF